MPAYRIDITPCDPGALSGNRTLKKGVVSPDGVLASVVINPTTAQIQGVKGYLGLIKAGDDTSTVETAITNLNP